MHAPAPGDIAVPRGACFPGAPVVTLWRAVVCQPMVSVSRGAAVVSAAPKFPSTSAFSAVLG